MRGVIFVLALLLSAFAHAELTLLKASRMLDVDSGEYISPAAILVVGEEILAVNPDEIPDYAETIDLGDMTLLPGLMDMHTHLTLNYYEGDLWTTAAVRETAADWALDGAEYGLNQLRAGFTTVREAGSWPGFPDVALMRAINSGGIVGPRIFPAGHYITTTGGHCDVGGFAPGIMELGPEQGVADGEAELLRAVRYQAKHGVKVIKVCATAGVFSAGDLPGAQQYSQRELEVIVEEASRKGLKVMAHAHGSEGIMAAVKAGVASIEHGSMLTREIAREMKRRGTYLVPTIYLNDIPLPPETPAATVAKNDFLRPHMDNSFQLAMDVGVNIAFGSDSTVIPHAQAGREFYAMVRRGMAPLEAIRTSTIYAADLLGVVDRGQIKTGMLADFVAVQGDPLEDIRLLENIPFVMKGGEVIKSTAH